VSSLLFFRWRMLRFLFLPLMSFGLAGEGRQQGELSGDTLVVPPPSTTPPTSASPARDHTDELILEEEGPTTMGTGIPPPATEVARRGEATSQQLDAGNQLPQSACYSFLYLSFSCLLELQS
jgi:hypothetical protein